MKQVRVTGVSIFMDVSDNYDRQEVQEHLDLLNLNLQRSNPGGQILGVNDLQDSDIVEDE